VVISATAFVCEVKAYQRGILLLANPSHYGFTNPPDICPPI